MALELEQTSFPSRDGTLLHLRAWRRGEGEGGVDDAKPALCIVHGFADHSGRYRYFAEHFSALGYPCYGVDYRGHGKAGGNRGFVERFEQYLDDVQAFMAEVHRREGSERKRVMVGHSMGGLIAAMYTCDTQRMGAEGAPAVGVLSSPAVGLSVKVPKLKELAANALSRWVPGFSMPTGVDLSTLTRNPEMVEETRLDPLYGKVATSRWFTEFVAAHAEAVRRAPSLQVPLCVFQAGDDRVVDAAATDRLVAALPGDKVRYEKLPGQYHELFNEPERGETFEKIDAWLAEQA